MVTRTRRPGVRTPGATVLLPLALFGAIVLAQDAPAPGNGSTPDGDRAVSPEPWHRSVRVEDLAPFPCAHGFRDRFANLLNHPDGRIPFDREEFADLLIAFETCMTFRGIEHPGSDIRDAWFRAITDGSFRRSGGINTFHPLITGTMASMLRAYTVAAPGPDNDSYRTLFADGRVVDFRAPGAVTPPAVFADGERVVVLLREADTTPYTMVVYAAGESGALGDELWRTRVETNLIIPPETTDGRTTHHAWCRRSGERYLVFGLHPDGFYVHLYAADGGEHLGGYAYHADPYGERGFVGADNINDADPAYAGRAW